MLIARGNVAAAVLLVALLNPIGASATEAKIPDRCHYIYSAVANRMAATVSGLVGRAKAYSEINYAHEAVQLAINLQCPVEPMLRTVDCSVELVRQRLGMMLGVNQILDCVESGTGEPFPTMPK